MHHKQEQQCQNKIIKERFGNTDAYKEYEHRKPSVDAANGLMSLFVELGEIRYLSVDEDAVQQKVAVIMDHNSANYYTCTNYESTYESKCFFVLKKWYFGGHSNSFVDMHAEKERTVL